MSTTGRRDRHQPQTITTPGLLVPAEDLPEVAVWLRLLVDLLSGRVPPAGARQPEVTKKLVTYAVLTAEAAREQETARHRSAAFPDETGQIGSPANLPAACDPQEEITVAQASDLTGYTQQYIRRLAQAGRIDGRQVDRDVWRLRIASVVSIRDSRKGADDSDGQAGADGPRRAASAGTGGGAPAA